DFRQQVKRLFLKNTKVFSNRSTRASPFPKREAAKLPHPNRKARKNFHFFHRPESRQTKRKQPSFLKKNIPRFAPSGALRDLEKPLALPRVSRLARPFFAFLRK